MMVEVIVELTKWVVGVFVQILADYGLAKNSTLEVLDLKCNRLSSLSAQRLARLLQDHVSLRVLSIAHNRLSDDGAAVIAEALPYSRSLEELDLRSCSIGDAGLDLLAKAITNSRSLSKVFVWGNGFGVNASAAWRDLALYMQEQVIPFFMDVEPYEVDGVPMVALSNDECQ
jgi:hypothetical protein